MKTKMVLKFGGTSVKTADAIRQVKNIIEQNVNTLNGDCSIFVVLSAVSGITNKLVTFCNQKSNVTREEILSEIKLIHRNLISELDIKNQVENEVISIIDKLSSFIDKKLDIKMVDIILSVGEELSSFLLNEFLKKEGLSSELLNSNKFMFTDENFGKAYPNIDKIKISLEQELKYLNNKIIVSQGFVGVTDKGDVTTLGRGGSDYSAALIAEAIEAEKLYIYTDVDGVYTIDPNIVPTAQKIDKISFQEMAEMANFGAKILHPSTLEPCLRSSIPVKILSTFKPDGKGTDIVFDKQDESETLIKAVTIRRKQILVTLKSINMVNAYGFLANIFNILAKYKISVDLITTSEINIALTIDGNMLGSQEINPFIENKELLFELEQFAEIKVEEDLTLISLIGSGLTLTGAIQKMLSSLEEEFIRLICYGASSSNISILTKKTEAEELAKKLHYELLEN
jgi:aspartate kinase